MEPIHDVAETEMVPSANEILQDVVETGRLMFAAGQRLVRDLDMLRGTARDSGWEIRLGGHRYFWAAASVGACLLLAAMFRDDNGGAKSNGRVQ